MQKGIPLPLQLEASMGRSNGLKMLGNCQTTDSLSACQRSGRATRQLMTPTCCVQTAPLHLLHSEHLPPDLAKTQLCFSPPNLLPPLAFPVPAGLPLPSPYTVASGQGSCPHSPNQQGPLVALPEHTLGTQD